jgi:tetratricopeptide (TPR) repeat protein
LVLWISLAARYLLWWSAWGLGALRRRLGAAALLLGIVVLDTWSVLEPTEALRWHRNLGHKLLQWLDALNLTKAFSGLVELFLGLTLLYLPFAVYRARRRLAIADFADYSGDPKQTAFVKGLASRMRTELATISTMYGALDGAWSSRPRQLVDLIPEAQDPGDFLRDAVTSDDKVSLGPARIPLRPVVTALSRLMQGPRLRGSLHRSGSGWLLVAEVSGWGPSRSWTVGTDELAVLTEGQDRAARADGSKPIAGPLDRLPTILAHRIFTELAPIGSNSWRAVYYYYRGLATFRETLRSDRDRRPNLLHAEQQLRYALEDDKTFARCHYDLGIVYRHLGNLKSAEAAFLRALEEAHEPSETYLALADTYFADGRFDDCLLFAGSARHNRSTAALAWNLTGCADRERRKQDGIALSPEDELAITRNHRRAVAMSWERLCASIASGQTDRRLTETAVRCLRDLARATARRSRFRLTERLLRQARRVDPRDLSIQVQLGRALFERRSFSKAIECLSSACDDRSQPAQNAQRELFAMAAHLHLYERAPSDTHRMAASFHYNRILDRSLDPEARRGLLEGLVVGDDDGGLRAALGRYVGERRAIVHRQRRDAGIGELPQQVECHQVNLHAATDAPVIKTGTCTSLKEYLDRLRGTFEFLNALDDKVADKRARAERLIELFIALCELRPRPSEDVITLLERLVQPSDQAAGPASAPAPAGGLFTVLRRRTGETEQLARDRLDAALGIFSQDWNWALAQVEVKLSQLERSRVTIDEIRCLREDAIRRLESHHQDQIRAQALHGQLGWAYLQLARAAGIQRGELLARAVHEAEHAVALEPGGAWERKQLAEVYVYLEDFDRAESELELSIHLKPNDPQTVGLIANIVWRRGLLLREPGLRRETFERGLLLLRHVLRLIESEPLRAVSQVDQLNALAWCHHLLGDFYAELRKYGSAIAHLKVALSLRYRPLESATDLALTYYEANAYDKADTAFRTALAIADAERARRSSFPEVDDSASERHLARLLLGWAMLDAERGLNLDRAEELNRHAQRHITRIARFEKRHPHLPPEWQPPLQLLWAKYHQCRGVICFQRGHLTEAIYEIESSLALVPISYAYLLLARYHVAKARNPATMASSRRQQIREACLRARDTDVRGEYSAEIDEILAAVTAVAPARHQAAGKVSAS